MVDIVHEQIYFSTYKYVCYAQKANKQMINFKEKKRNILCEEGENIVKKILI